MKKVLLWIWQLPQNLIGLLVILFTKARYNDISYKRDECFWLSHEYDFGVCLGEYIIIGANYNRVLRVEAINHEKGHRKQSRMLGPLYLLLIGLPSITFNIWDRLFHKTWAFDKRVKWYYNLPWEHWADKLGGVKR